MNGEQSNINPEMKTEEAYRIELIRKAIHLSSLAIPIIYAFVGRSTALSILIPLTTLVLAVDLSRHYITSAQKLYLKYFGWLLRQHETDASKKNLNGATYVLLSASFCVFFFPKTITITSFSVLIISDTIAALIGKRYGKPRFFGKSIEGSLAFFLSGVAVVALTPKVAYLPVEYIFGAIAVLIGTIVEAIPVGTDDNFAIPIATGSSLWLMYTIFLPELNVLANF